MPRLFTNRPRRYDFITPKTIVQNHISWESTNAILYLVGGISFIMGSIFFLPQYEALSDLGAWIFFGGSLIYLLVTGHDLLESTAYLYSQKQSTIWNWLELIVANFYVGGTILFTVGSLLFLSEIDQIVVGGWCFTIGSFFFLVGACINAIQIIQERSLMKLQLLNATAITFALGSTLFFIASLPYLSEALNIDTNRVLFRYVGWEYIIGSVLFLLGGIFNYYRLYEKTNKDKDETLIVEWKNQFQKSDKLD